MKTSQYLVVIFILCVGLLIYSRTSSNKHILKDLNVENDVNTNDTAKIPTIDCLLRKQGINPHELKPFEEVQKYIDFLNRADRELWQKPKVILDALNLKGSEKVADVGAGSGYFTFRLAKLLPNGKVYAIDVEPEMIRHIHHTAVKEKLQRIEAILATPDNPHVPADADLVFICDVLHHIKDRGDWLKALYSQMKAGSRLVVIEFKEGDLPEGPPEEMKITRGEMVALLNNAGFLTTKQNTNMLPYQYYLEFEKNK